MKELKTLNHQVELIHSQADFVKFLKNLSMDLKENPQSWENIRLECFLDAMAAWIEDRQGFYKNRGDVMPQEISWQVFGQILLAAKFYE